MKVKIKLGANDTSIQIPLLSVNNLLGYDDDVLSMVNNAKDESINEVTDGEVRRYLPLGNKSITFRFWNGSTYIANVAPLEYTGSTDYLSMGARNSFYVVQVYDSYRDEIQKKVHTGYYNGFDFAKTNLNSTYTYSNDKEFTNFYLPESILNSTTGSSVTFYLKFLFYSAKSGKFYTFFNASQSFSDQQKLYYKIVINKLTYRYSFDTSTNLILQELRNTSYNDFINNTVDSFPVEEPVYPSGNTFTNSGIYKTQ